MITINEASAVDMTALAEPMADRPRRFRRRTASESLGDSRRGLLAGLSLDDELLLERNTVQRSSSCSEVYAQRRELQRLDNDNSRYRVQLRCRDEAMCVRTKENMLWLVETAQRGPASSTSVLLAKKALKYRHLLDRAQQIDLSDPTVDVAQFLSEKRDGRTQLVGFAKPSQAP